jgi:LPS O-antigen subunit length determinant protein (WzzB/FepE family)
MPILFPDDWDRKAKKWLVDKPPTVQDGIKQITGLMTVNSDIKKGTLKFSFEHRSPETAKDLVEYFLSQMSEIMREVVLRDAAENMRFLTDQLDRTTDSLMRAKIYDMLAKEIEKDTFARAQKYYGFYVPDPPVVPDIDKKAKPKRALICILSVVVAFFIAFFLEYLGRVKTDDPDRYRQLREGLKLRKGK